MKFIRPNPVHTFDIPFSIILPFNLFYPFLSLSTFQLINMSSSVHPIILCYLSHLDCIAFALQNG
jgi:hypothetical protein